MLLAMHVVVYFKCLPQICPKMNGFKFDFFLNSWRGAHRAPSPDPSSVSSRASPSVRALPSILRRFAPSTRASPSILDSGFALNIRLGNLVWPPQNKFLDPPLSHDDVTSDDITSHDRVTLDDITSHMTVLYQVRVKQCSIEIISVTSPDNTTESVATHSSRLRPSISCRRKLQFLYSAATDLLSSASSNADGLVRHT